MNADKTFKYVLICMAAFALLSIGIFFVCLVPGALKFDDLIEDSQKVVVSAAVTLNTLNENAENLKQATRVIKEKTDGTLSNLNAVLLQLGLITARVREVLDLESQYYESISSDSRAVFESLRKSAESLNDLVQRTDSTINDDLLPQVRTTVAGFDPLLEQANLTIEKMGSNLESLQVVIEDPAIKQALVNLEGFTKETRDMIAEDRPEIKGTLVNLKEVTGDMSSISKRSNKWHPVIIGVRIIGAAKDAFLDWIF